MRGSAILPMLIAGLTPLAVLVLIISATAFGPIAWQPPILWMDAFRPSAINSASVIGTDSAALYVEGYEISPPLPGSTGSLVLSKYTLDGSPVWNRTIGNTGTAYLDSISVVADGIYIAGGNFSGGGLVVKYDTSGGQVWTRRFGGGAVGPVGGVAAGPSGVYVAGVSTLLTNQSFKGPVVFAREYDSAGNVVWTQELTNATADVNGLYASASGVYIVGSVGGSLPGSTLSGYYDAFLAKFTVNGTLAWTRQFGTPQFSATAYDVSGDSTGIYASGNAMSAGSGFLRKYDFTGNLVWADQINPPDAPGVGDSQVSVDSSGVYVSMSTAGGHEFIMKYDLNGGRLWSFQMQNVVLQDGNTGTEAFRLTTGLGGLYLVGTVPDRGATAGLVAKIASSPSLVFFGVNPPFSFVILAALVTVAVTSLFFFRRLRRRRVRPKRVGPLDRSLPVRD
jgi:hypothetical protein